MLFKEFPMSQEPKKKNRIKRPERNRKELTERSLDSPPVQENLTREDVLDLMGVRDRGLKRRRGAWRKV